MVWRNPLLQEGRDPDLLGKVSRTSSWREKVVPHVWKPIATPIYQLPDKLKSMVENRKHFRMGKKMVRSSPENEIGLSKATTSSTGIIKAFTFQESLTYSYLNDNRFLLLLCLLIGFGVWWAARNRET